MEKYSQYLILVEGVADQQFLIHYLRHLYGFDFKEGIVNKDVYEALNVTLRYMNGISQLRSHTFINEIQKTEDDGGKVLVVVDADSDYQRQKEDILRWRNTQHFSFDLFLFPNNSDNGELESLLERIINNQNQEIFDCWNRFEEGLKEISIPWKEPDHKPTIPAKKTKIYAYLETLLGNSKSQKELIKERNRNYSDSNHWNLDSEYIMCLKGFFDQFFQP